MTVELHAPTGNGASASAPILRAHDIVKSFGGAQALRGVSFEVAPVEVHALIGENGAGKSTLVKILAGMFTPDSGTIAINGDELTSLTQSLALKHGIAMVPQEIAVVPRMTVAESMALKTGRFFARSGLIRWSRLHSWAQLLLDEWDLGISARSRMSGLTPAQNIAVSVVSALNLDSPIRVFILDEPTASFSPPEVKHLFGVVRRLKAEGRSIIYVTHRLDEVLELCDRVTVVRDGKIVGTRPTVACTREDLVTLIVGHSVASGHGSGGLPEPGEVVLDVDGIARGRTGPISFSVRSREVVGFAGLVGAGRTELFRLIFGLDKPESGAVCLDGRALRIASPSVAVHHRIALVPEERRAAGLVMGMSVRENIALMTLARYAGRFTRLLRKRAQRAAVEEIADAVQLRAMSIEMPVRHLSGGNQQKVVIARCLSARSRLLIFDEPARGVDIGAKEEIFELIRQSARDGAAVLVASSETEDLVGLCHRVLVMSEGKLVAELAGNEINANEIARLCFGPALASARSV